MKQLINAHSIQNAGTNESSSLPPWIHPDSTLDTWYIPKKGRHLHREETTDSPNAFALKFEYEFNDGSSSLSHHWRLLLGDIQKSCIALFEQGIITRTNGFISFIRTVYQVVDHALEEAQKNNVSTRILTLEEISEENIKSFLAAHSWQLSNLETSSLREILTSIEGNHLDKCHQLLRDLGLSRITRRVLIQKLKDQDRATRLREYRNVLELDEEDAPLSTSSIKNKILDLKKLFKVRAHQDFKFNLGPAALDRCYEAALHEVDFAAKQQTPLMPIAVAQHYISESIRFHRDYAPALVEYIRSLDENFRIHILENYEPTTIRSRIDDFKQRIFEITDIPLALRDINLKTFGYAKWRRGPYTHHGILREHISTTELVNMYTITTKILIHTFTACRSRSVDDLLNNCLTFSKLDGLWDIIFTAPKIGNTNELQTVTRPIPEVIWKFIRSYIEFIFADTEKVLPLWQSYTKKSGTQGYTTANKYLDQFADWTNAPIFDGRRWYARPHQFRRFFAALFLYLDEDADLEPLRWMMTHLDDGTTFYYADVTSDPEWKDEAYEFIKSFIEGKVRKEVIIDDDIIQPIKRVKEEIFLGDPYLIDQHIKRLIKDYSVKVKILNMNEVLIYGLRK
ncbi:hypothetical protein LT17_03736 [Pseudomonas aeruginosa]|uniref:hypothetical protein n=1 Tax=Pseudomonas aeruginosa TaxID=287 RepID=UPI000799C791|nr:hypothetical protein [Pseudomonas aeruginosa]KXG14944.1 hypothetical protein LT17_03736 [Pseudomonas aeruginosa]RTR54480.1 hypothetical protein DY931_32075 [Pseudomonas aeruginosa]RTR63989.1 hypothetical protein DY930_34315 [Pseudomonas aeruginosa]